MHKFLYLFLILSKKWKFNYFRPIHGLIFLFKWIGNTEIDGSFVTDSRLDDIIFVKQVIENACATQAIISVLLNCKHSDIDLGDNLKDFKSFVSNFDPDVIIFSY